MEDMCATVGASRKLSPDSLNAYADRYIMLTDAKDYKKLKAQLMTSPILIKYAHNFNNTWATT